MQIIKTLIDLMLKRGQQHRLLTNGPSAWYKLLDLLKCRTHSFLQQDASSNII